jgi:hypothetical protein
MVQYECRPPKQHGISLEQYERYLPGPRAPSTDTYSINTDDQPGRPLDWLPKAVNWVVDRIPDGKRRLQEARAFTDRKRRLFEGDVRAVSKLSDRATPKTPVDFLFLAIGPQGVTRRVGADVAVAGSARVGATLTARVAEEFAETPAGRALGSSIPTKVKPGPVMPHEGSPTAQTPIGEPPPKSPGGPPEGPPPSKPPTGEPPEVRGPPPGSNTNPLRGSAIVQNAKNLAGKTIDLGTGGVVTVGDPVALPGSIGAVYKIPGRPNELLKVIHSTKDLGGAGAVLRQARGSKLLDDANMPNARVLESPTKEALESGAAPPYLIVENLHAGQWAAKGAEMAKGEATKAQRTAVEKLYTDMGDRGLVWLDGHLNNVFFYREGRTLKAAILDQDFIYPFNELKKDIDAPATLLGTPAMHSLSNALTNPGSISAGKLMSEFFESLYPLGKK